MRRSFFGTSLFVVASLLLTGLLSCGGSRPSLDPKLLAFDRFERETASLDPGERASDLLQKARGNRSEADRLLEDAKPEEAEATLERALADVHLAWAFLRLERAERDEAAARRTMEDARQEWENAMIILENAEQSAERSAKEVSRNLPVAEQGKRGPLPISTLHEKSHEGQTSRELRRHWDLWAEAAADRTIPIADLRTHFEERIDLAENAETKEPPRILSLYVAGRILEELEVRIRSAETEHTRAHLMESGDRLRVGAQEAYRATIKLQTTVEERLKAEVRSREDTMFAALQKLEGEFARITKEARGTIVSLSDILFDFDKVHLKRDVEYNLVRIATILNQFPEMAIVVEGHTDNIGTENYNLKLSEERAQAVHDFLATQGVARPRMTVKGYGLSKPMAPNRTEEGRGKNRRVDLVIR